MRTNLLLAGLVLAGSLASAQSKLQVKVFTSTPEGYNVNSTLIYGEKDAILVDPQFLLSVPAALKPAVVVPGHQTPNARNDLSVIDFMKKYMQDWDQAVAASKNADELKAAVMKSYPNLGMEQLLNNGATAAFQPAKGK